MLSNLRNFSKSRFAPILVAIIIIPFLFWGMGGVFSGGNTNNIVKINKYNVSTEDFINYVNSLNLDTKDIGKCSGCSAEKLEEQEPYILKDFS